MALLFLCVLAVSACTSSSALNGSTSWPGLTVENDIVYTANGGLIEAVQNGSKLWNYPESANNRVGYYAAPAVDENYVYAGTYTNQLHVINKSDGTLAASIEVGNNKNKIIASPLLADGNVIVLSSGGMVSSYPTAFSGDTIVPNWQTVMSGEVWVKPVYDNGTLYVASMDKKINMINAESGVLQNSVSISGAIMNDPVLSDGKLYFSTLAKEVDEMDLTGGNIRTLLTTNGEIWASPLVMGDRLIAADMSGYVYCIDIKTADPVWTTEQLSTAKTGFIASPAALDEDTILLVDEIGETMTYDKDGKSVGQRSLGMSVYTTPAVLDNGSVVFLPVSADGQIKVYTPELKEDWFYVRADGKSEAKTEKSESEKEAK